jgi:homoserine kinase
MATVSRRRVIRVPASSANLGPGYDVLAAALQCHLELEVSEADEFSIDPGSPDLPADRENLIVRSFERLHSADGLRFQVIANDVPLARGMGSSAAAIVAGLLAADSLFELGNSREDLLGVATEIEGHPDNVAAALYGGIVACPPPGPAPRPGGSSAGLEALLGESTPADAPLRLEPPQGVEGILVIPGEEVSTADARTAIPERVKLVDAVANLAALAHLVTGIERSDLGLIARGLADRLHQPAREHLYPRSMEIVRDAAEIGAIGATISGAGPTVLVWCYWQSGAAVADALAERAEGWAEIRRIPFTPLGAEVTSL